MNRQNLHIKTKACQICLSRPCVCIFCNTLGKRVVTKSHQPSLNCLFAPERQLSEQEIGTSDSSRSDTSDDEAISKKTTAWGGFAFHTTRGHMKSNIKALLAAAAGMAAFAFSPANAFEGGVQWQSKPGVFIGASAGVPPPGIYMFDQIFTYQSNLAGPITNAVGTHNGVQAAVDVQGFLFVPGWTFLGATYDAVLVQPFGMVSVGQPVSLNAESGGHVRGRPQHLLRAGRIELEARNQRLRSSRPVSASMLRTAPFRARRVPTLSSRATASTASATSATSTGPSSLK